MWPRTVRVFLVVAVLWCAAGIEAQEAETEPKSRLVRSKWLGERGPSDPRPYEGVLLGTGLLNRKYFDWKNRLWIENGISFGSYVSSNVQWGSEGGPSHSISETLLLFTWEPVRDQNKAGRLVAGFAHDRTFGRPTTREFADIQNLVETPNDLDTHPDLIFSTLGLLHWEQEWWTGPNRGWGLRAGQIYAPSYFGPARYLDDDRRFFMARPLAAAGGAQWVGYNDIGLGANGIAWKDPFYVSVAFIDGKANRQYPDFASFFDGQFLYLGEVGFERAVERGIPYAIHNDPPVSPPNALHSMWVAVNRLTTTGEVLGPEQRITAEQALLAYTRQAATVLGIEDEVGTLEPGKYADFVVLSDNPLEVDPMKIKDIEVEATVMNGRITYFAQTEGFYHH